MFHFDQNGFVLFFFAGTWIQCVCWRHFVVPHGPHHLVCGGWLKKKEKEKEKEKEKIVTFFVVVVAAAVGCAVGCTVPRTIDAVTIFVHDTLVAFCVVAALCLQKIDFLTLMYVVLMHL